MIGVVLFVAVLVVALVLAFAAGYGIGSSDTYAELRPERIAKDLQTETVAVLQGMREVHDTAVRAISESPPRRVEVPAADPRVAVHPSVRRRREGRRGEPGPALREVAS